MLLAFLPGWWFGRHGAKAALLTLDPIPHIGLFVTAIRAANRIRVVFEWLVFPLAH
jgi:hypothetical protein